MEDKKKILAVNEKFVQQKFEQSFYMTAFLGCKKANN